MNAVRTLSRRTASAAAAVVTPNAEPERLRRLLFCNGIGSTSHDLISERIERWSSRHQIPFHNIQYRNYGKADVLWSVDDWKADVIAELKRISSLKDSWNTGMEELYPDCEVNNDIILVCNSAAVQAAFRALLTSEERSMMPSGILMISPGVGVTVQNYVDRLMPPGSMAALKAGGTFYHPSADPSLRIRVNLESVQNFANGCPTIKNADPIPIDCPVRIIHGIWDKLVPYRNSVALLDRITTKDKALYLVSGGHLMKDLNIIEYAMDSLWQAVNQEQ